MKANPEDTVLRKEHQDREAGWHCPEAMEPNKNHGHGRWFDAAVLH